MYPALLDPLIVQLSQISTDLHFGRNLWHGREKFGRATINCTRSANPRLITETMQGSAAQPEAILEWLQKEMGYRPLGPYASSAKASAPTAESLRKICRGNMIPVWSFLLKRVKSEKTVENIRRNILVHGADDVDKGRRKEKVGVGKEGTGNGSSSREMALQEREVAEKEVERLRQIVRRQRKELKARMMEVSREEAERKRMLDERSNYRLISFANSLNLFTC